MLAKPSLFLYSEKPDQDQNESLRIDVLIYFEADLMDLALQLVYPPRISSSTLQRSMNPIASTIALLIHAQETKLSRPDERAEYNSGSQRFCAATGRRLCAVHSALQASYGNTGS